MSTQPVPVADDSAALSRIRAAIDNGEPARTEDLEHFPACASCRGMGGDAAGPCIAKGCVFGYVVPR